MNLPIYDTTAGNKFKEASFTERDLRVKIESTMPEECVLYKNKLLSMGYTLVSQNELPSSMIYKPVNNLFYRFTNGTEDINFFYDAPGHSAYICASDAMPIYTPKAELGEKKAKPFYAQLNISKGLCHVARLCSGEFVIIDSGLAERGYDEIIYNFLCENNVNAKPTVALWLFTHPDPDHICAADEFMRKYSDAVDISGIAYQFPDFDYINISGKYPKIKEYIRSFEEAIAKNYKDTPVYALHTGDEYRLLGATLSVIWTVDNTFSSELTNVNDTSAAFLLNFDGGKRIAILGDCTDRLSASIEELYGENLKSDVLQVTHHGLLGGNTKLYRSIDPDICLWSVEKERFLGDYPTEKHHWCLGEGGCEYNSYLRDESIKKRTHYTANDDCIIYV